MSTVVSAVEARKNFGKLLNIVSLRHEEVVIERAGKRIAKLVSCDEESQPAAGKLSLLSAAGIGEGGVRTEDVGAYIERERGEWD